DPNSLGWKLSVWSRRFPMSQRQQRAHNSKRPALVVDQAPRAELRERKEPLSLQVGLSSLAVAAGRNIGKKGQPRKVVARQEPLCSQVAIRVEITRKRARASLKQVELIDGLRMPGLRCALLLVRSRVVIHRPASCVSLFFCSGEEIAPAIERLAESVRRRRHDCLCVFLASCVPGGQI